MTQLEIHTAPLEAPGPAPALAPAPERRSASRRSREDLARTTMGVFFMAGLGAAAVWIVSPFVPALIWATMIVVATWPLMLLVQRRLWGRRSLAVVAMTTALLLTLIVPFSLALAVILAHSDDIASWVREIPNLRIPTPPAWIETVPIAGPRLWTAWNDLAAAAPEAMTRWLQPHVSRVAQWSLAQVGNVGLIAVQFLLTVILSAVLYARGEQAGAGAVEFFRRLAGVHGEKVVLLAAQAIRGVALGVVVTAVVQSALGGIGLAAADVPFAGFLTAIMFLLAVAQIGPGPVLLGAVVWVFVTSESAWIPYALLVWSIFVGTIDNVLRPILIKRGGDLPLLIVFAGVIGGLLAFGVVGIFVGPVVLAVVYTLLKAWVTEAPRDDGGAVAVEPPLERSESSSV